MYADKDKQREANRRHARAYRGRKGMTGMTTSKPSHSAGMTPSIIPDMPSVWGGPRDYDAWSPLPAGFVVDDKMDSVPRVKSVYIETEVITVGGMPRVVHKRGCGCGSCPARKGE